MSESSASMTGATPARLRDRPALVAFIVIVLAVALERLPTIGFAYLNVDESAYLLIGAALRHGAIPYIDIIDRKPVGLYLIYALADAIFPDAISGARILGGLCTILSAWIVVQIGRRFLRLSWTAATLAGVWFSVYAILYGGDAAQYNVFVMPFVAGAAFLVLRALETMEAGAPPSVAEVGVSGLMLGLAMQVKYTPAFEATGFGLLLIFVGWRNRAALGTHGIGALSRGIALMILGGLLPTAIAVAVYWHLGHLDAFIFYNFTVNMVRTATDYPGGLLMFRIGEVLLAVHPLLIFSVLYAARGGAKAASAQGPAHKWVDAVLTIWLAAAAFGALVQRQPYMHYFYAIVPPLAIFSLAKLGAHGNFSKAAKRWLVVYTVAPIVGYAAGWTFETWDHGSPMLPREIAKTLRAENVSSLYVFNAFGIIYYLSGLESPTKFTLPTHLLRDLEAASFQFDAVGEVRRILDSHPQVIVVTRPFAGNIAPNRVQLLEAELQASYCTWRTYEAGRDKVYLYRYEGIPGDSSRPCRSDAVGAASSAQR